MTDLPRPTRMFGLPGAETVYRDVATVWETELEPYLVFLMNPADWDQEILEFDVLDPKDPFRRADLIVEDIVEWAMDSGEVCEGWPGNLDVELHKDPDVLAVAEKLRDVMASKVRFDHAGDVVARHRLTLDDQHRPHLDGQPLYRPG